MMTLGRAMRHVWRRAIRPWSYPALLAQAAEAQPNPSLTQRPMHARSEDRSAAADRSHPLRTALATRHEPATGRMLSATR